MGVSSSLTGVIGRRTQYQQVDIAQLVLEVATTGSHDNMDSKEEDLNATVFPKVNYQYVCVYMCVCMFVCVCTYIYIVCVHMYVRTGCFAGG